MNKNKGLAEIVGGSLWMFLGLVSGYILEYANKIIIARVFGASDYGVICLALTFATIFVTFSLLGLHIGATRYIAIYAAKERKSEIKAIVIQGLKIILPISLLFSIVFFLGKGFIISHFIKKLPDTSVILPFILLIPIAAMAEYFQSCLRGLKLAKYSILSKEIIRKLIILVTLVSTIFIWKSLIFVSLAYLLGFVGYMLSAVLWTRKNTSCSSKDYSEEFKVKDLITFSLPLVFSFMLTQISPQISNVFLGYFREPKEVAFLSIALRLSSFVSFPLAIVLFMFLPIMSEYWSKNECDELKTTFKTICRWLFFISGFIFLIFILYSKPIIVYTFGKEFEPAHKALIILSIGQFFNAICGLNGALLLALGESKKYFIRGLISTIFTLALYPMVVPKFGFLGAAYVNMIDIVLLNLIGLIFVYKRVGAHPFNLNILFTLIIFSLVLPFLKNILYLDNLVSQIFIATMIYFIVIIITGVFSKKDISFFYDLLKKEELP